MFRVPAVRTPNITTSCPHRVHDPLSIVSSILLFSVYTYSFYTIFPLISASSTVISHIIDIKLLPYFSVFLLLCLCRSEFETYRLCRSILPSFPSQSISILHCCIATLLEQKFILALIRHHAIKMLHVFLMFALDQDGMLA